MSKQLLLVDDEELFLRSLQEGLRPFADVFETDICFSFGEAIERVSTKQYDLIVTDIRMPGRSGMDLLIYLHETGFKGKVIIMSAEETECSSRSFGSFGVLDVICKPFKFEWFRDKLVDFFTSESKQEKELMTFEPIDLVTVMQIVNLEGKTSALEIETKQGKGIIYFEGGDIINAEYGDLVGDAAVIELVAKSEGKISVKNVQGKIPRVIHLSFVEYMMQIMQTIDEKRRDDERERAEQTSTNLLPEIPGNKTLSKEANMAISENLAILKEINGYLGAGVFTPQGEMLEGVADISGVQFEEAGALIHDTLKDAKAMATEIGFGNLDLIQLYTQMGIIFAKCYNDGTRHFHTILVIKTDGNIAMARMKLNKVVELLIPEF